MTSIGIGSIIPDKVMPIADETSNGFPQSPIKYNKIKEVLDRRNGR